MGHREVDQQIAGIITSEPAGILFFSSGFVRHDTASKFAEEPEFVISAYFAPICLAKIFSNFFVIFYIVRRLERKTLIPAFISFVEKAFVSNGYLKLLIIVFNYNYLSSCRKKYFLINFT